MSTYDWQRLTDLDIPAGEFLPGTCIELRRPVSCPAARAVLFDFDGTLSLIRSGWTDVMVPMMVEELLGLETGESREELTALVSGFVAGLTGKQTIYQMMELAAQVTRRGGKAQEPLAYKHRYLDLLWERIHSRVADIREGRSPPDSYLVPGSRVLLEALRDRGLRIFIASGTDEKYAAAEAELLGVASFAEGKVYGAQDDYQSFSKRMLIERIIAEHALAQGELLGFGDGFVEIEDVKARGGVAVGVATEEPACRRVDAWKRSRLILAGADIVIPHYLESAPLLSHLLGA